MNDKRQMNDFLMNVKPLLGAVARFENLGGHIVLGGNNVPPQVEIGLTDLPKSGGARAPRPPRLRRAWNITKISALEVY